MLMIANETTKLGVNNDVNRNTHKASLRLMAADQARPIRQTAIHQTQFTNRRQQAKKTTTTTTQTLATTTQAPATDTSKELTTDPVDQHHVNKALVAFGALAFVVSVIWAAAS